MKFEQTKEVLNQLVADLSQMAMVVHQTHWYMRGPGFLTLHPMMDDFMDDLNDQLDVISERLITLDGSPTQHYGKWQTIHKSLMKSATGIVRSQNV